MKTNIVKVKYEDNFNPKTFSGKAYSYFTTIDLQVGDLVEAPTQYGNKIARVSEVDISENEIMFIRPYMKIIERKLNKAVYLDENKIIEDVA